MKKILIGFVLLAGLGYGGAKAYVHYKASDGVDAAVMAIAPFAKMEYSGISSTLSGELTVDDVRIQVNGYRDEIYIGRMGINTPSFLALLELGNLLGGSWGTNGGVPEYFGLIAEEIRVSASADYYRDIYTTNIEALAPDDIGQRGVQCVGKYGYSPKALRELGYEELVVSTSITLRQAESHYLAEIDLDIVAMIDVEFDVEMAGNLMTLAAGGAGYQPTLRSLEMKLTDHSLNQRAEKYCTELGLTPEQILNAHLNSLQYFGSQYGVEFDAYVIDPYKEYLAGKSTFILTAKPREPIQLARISRYRPSDVPALLNLEAVAE